MEHSTIPEIIDSNLSKIEKRNNWEFAIGMNQIDGPWEPDEEFKGLIEKQINGEITTNEMVKFLVKKYTVSEDL